MDGHCPGHRCLSSRIYRDSLLLATSGADRSSAAPRPSARDPWQLRWSISDLPRWAVNDMSSSDPSDQPGEMAVAGPSEEAVAEFSLMASQEQISAVATELERNGVLCHVVDSAEEARGVVQSILPIGAEVYNNTSRTLELIGVADDIERSGRYQALRPRLYQMDREMQE